MRFWLITKDRVGWLEPLTTKVIYGRRTLGIFGFEEEEARLFLRLRGCRGWRVRATSVGELVSVSSGPCRGVELVALDPLPGGRAEALNGLLCVDRGRFVEFLLRKDSGHHGGRRAFVSDGAVAALSSAQDTLR